MSNWTELFDELTRVFKDVSKLLLDADGMMGQRGYLNWKPRSSAVGTETSTSVWRPEEWYPRWVGRYYLHESDETQSGPCLFVAVFLSDQAKAGDWARKQRIEQPLVIAGVISQEDGATQALGWHYWDAKSWFWENDKLETRQREVTHQRDEVTIRSFAIELQALSDTASLAEKVIKPLLGMVPS